MTHETEPADAHELRQAIIDWAMYCLNPEAITTPYTTHRLKTLADELRALPPTATETWTNDVETERRSISIAMDLLATASSQTPHTAATRITDIAATLTNRYDA